METPFIQSPHSVANNQFIINLSGLLDYFEKLNESLLREEEFDREERKIRRIIFKLGVLNQLVPFHEFILKKLNSHKDNILITTLELLNNQKELVSTIKLIKTYNESLRLIINLTSPLEFLSINQNFLFPILHHFDLIAKPGYISLDVPDFINEISLLNNENLQKNDISALINANIFLFKEALIKSNIFCHIGESLVNLISYYKSISQTFHAQKSIHSNPMLLKQFKLLNNILFDSLVLNLALIRNLSVDKGESNYSLVVNLLLEANLEPFLFQLSNLGEINKSFLDNKKFDQRAFVCYCLLTQIMSLLFSKIAMRAVSPNSDRSDSPSISSASSGSLQQLQNDQTMSNFQVIQKKLFQFAKKFSNSDSFANIVEQMIQLLSKPVDLYVYYDLSYFLWLIKFLTQNFILKELNKKSVGKKKSQENKIKNIFINYDLFSFLTFVVLESFEQLIFDSNLKNMNLLRLFKLKSFLAPTKETYQEQFNKVTNVNSLKLLSTSISCLNELLNYVNYYLDLVNSFKIFNTELTNFLFFLNELLHFDELKQLFPLLMRFYCYNQHVYSNSLVKKILITNQVFLRTIKRSYELIRKIINKEHERESDGVLSDTNATKNSSSILSSTLSYSTFNATDIYNLYTNTHTSHILKDVLSKFVHNDPILNRCVIDFLDSLMRETDKHQYLFHMNFALALANIATLDNFHSLDQHTKDIVSNLLNGIKRLCKKRPYFANKILFNINYCNDKLNEENEFGRKKKRKISEVMSSSDFFMDSDSNSFSFSKNSTYTSSISSLRSKETVSPSESSPDNTRNAEENSETNEEMNNGDELDQFEALSLPSMTELNPEINVLIENEFLYCIKSMKDLKTKQYKMTEIDGNNEQINYLFDSQILNKIIIYLVDLFTSKSLNSNKDLNINSWKIYNCLLNMKFSMDDKIKYLNELNDPKSKGNNFSKGINLSLGPMKNEFFKSNECIRLRQACNADEFGKALKEAYLKFLTNRLFVKSKRTRNALFWILNILKNLKLYVFKKTMNMDKNTNDLNHFILVPSSKNSTFHSKIVNTTMEFQVKLTNYYYAYKHGIPLIPFKYELQQVFHSEDFFHFLDVLGIVGSKRGFPFIPNDWLDVNKTNLSENLSLLEKCLCV